MSKYLEKFQSGKYYHVYNRAIGNDNLFYRTSNYNHFFNLYQNLINPLVETYSYCLIPNHFHLLIRVLDELVDPSDELSEAFRKLSISYAQAINNQENRKGSLFMRPLKRKIVEEDSYLTRIMIYIHQNPYNHGLLNDYTQYKWSSYSTILSNSPTLIKRKEVLEWFGGKEEFVDAHQQTRNQQDLSKFTFD